MGCETTGYQLLEIAKLTRGEVVGINIGESFPSEEASSIAGSRSTLVNMSGTELTFPDASFDMVISANVIEHVPDPVKFITEARRVLKPTGICYMETAPVWTGPKGHHVMECMVSENCPWETNFHDDSSIIPDWSHLTHSRSDMEAELEGKVDARTKDWILQYLYDSNDLNKVPWKVVRQAFVDAFPLPRIQENQLPTVQSSRMPTDGLDDYLVCGFSSICRVQPQNAIEKRLFWRLRRLGL